MFDRGQGRPCRASLLDGGRVFVNFERVRVVVSLDRRILFSEAPVIMTEFEPEPRCLPRSTILGRRAIAIAQNQRYAHPMQFVVKSWLNRCMPQFPSGLSTSAREERR